jgi:asparagine synthase (glutamine-hydrolysing)
MSGICAVLSRTDPALVSRTLAPMIAGLSLHADEKAAQFIDNLSAVAVSSRFPGQQVFSNARVLVACDADLHNGKQLHGYVDGNDNPSTASLMARLYERLGEGFLEKLRGAFSVVIWDRLERKLIAAIDGFGVKRLTYYEDQNAVLIASRLTAVAQTGAAGCAINPKAIANYLSFGSSLAPETIIAGIRRLEPGTVLIADQRGARTRRYWDMQYDGGEGGDSSRLSRQLEAVVADSVALHCEDPFGGVGAFLSGGTDSSTVVGMMSRLNRGPVDAFSIGFEDEHFNELEYARIAAREFNARHHTYNVSPEDCFEALPHIVRAFDEPCGNNSAIPTYFCVRLAAQAGVTTMLAGDGGDELFGGNERYCTDKIFAVYQQIPALLRRGVIEPGLSLLPFENGLVGKARRYIRRSNIPNPQRFFSYHFLLTHAPEEVFDAGFLRTLDNYPVLEIPGRHYSRVSARADLDRLLYVDVKITLGDDDLPKVTSTSELAGVQPRFPFLDRPVAEFSGTVPARLKVKGLQKRYLFKQAFQSLLPAEIIQKKKHGFGIPVCRWLKSHPPLRELAYDVLLSQRSFERGYFHRPFIEELFRMFESDESTYYGDTLWSFLTLELWHREYADRWVSAVV